MDAPIFSDVPGGPRVVTEPLRGLYAYLWRGDAVV